METWKLLLVTLLSAVVLGCVVGVITGKRLVKKARGGYQPLLTAKERVVYSLLVIFGAACVAVGVFVVPSVGGLDEAMVYDEFGNPMPGGMMEGENLLVGDMVDGVVLDDGMGGDIMVNNATTEEAVESEIVEDDLVGGAYVEGEAVDGEETEEEPAEGETVEGEAAEGEAAEAETEAEAEATETEAEVEVAQTDEVAMVKPAPQARPSRVRGGGGAVVVYEAR
jgi:hypothetical protein